MKVDQYWCEIEMSKFGDEIPFNCHPQIRSEEACLKSTKKIIDLAKKIIELSGMTLKNKKNPNGDIEIKITGLKLGEKIHEELYINKEITKTNHPILHLTEHLKDLLDLKLKKLKDYLKENKLRKAKELIYKLNK